jgi:hypothetical protein
MARRYFTMPGTPLQCGYLHTADLQCRLPPRLSALSVDLISSAARTWSRCPYLPPREQQISIRSRYDLVARPQQ